MKLYKKSERVLKTGLTIAGFKKTGLDVINLGRWCKWKEIERGRLQVKFDIYEMRFEGKAQGYIVSDSLDRVACPIVLDKKEVFDWLKEHGYKSEKQWYLEDYGMDEETWNEWNNAE